MATPLESAWAKIRRAEHHLETLEVVLSKFGRDYSYTMVGEFDADTGEKLWRLTSDPTIPPASFSAWIGEIIYDFRSALDHLAFQLVTVNGHTPNTRTAFPIFNDPGLFKEQAGSKMRGMSPAAIAAIEAMQPCNGVNPLRNAVFWSLETLCNIDKHRHFNLIVGSTMGGFWLPAGLPMDGQSFVHCGPIENGTVLARVPKEHADVEFAPAFDIAFGDAPIRPTSQGVQYVLSGIQALLRHEIQWFENEFFS